MEIIEAEEIIREMIYKAFINCDKLFALCPEGNDKPLRCFMQKNMIRFTFGED